MSQVQLCSLSPINYKGIPCISTEMLAQAYEVEINSIQKNFSCNRERFTEGKHFFALAGDELRALKNCLTESKSVQIDKRARNFTLWTERGAARHAKMLNSDRAWDVFELLEETFFRVVKDDAAPTSGPLTPSHRAELKAIVDAKLSTYPAELQGKARAELWTRFNRHFKIAEYAQLPVSRLAEARDYLIEVQMRTYPKQAEEPKRLESDLETHCIALRTLSRQMNEHIAEIYSIVRHAIPPRNAPSERRSLALLSMNGMEDASSAVGCNLNAIESSARAVLLASRA